MTAYEAVISRQAGYAAAAVAQYYGVMFDATGKFAKADGSRPFAGVVQYGASAADEIITVVKGDYPVIATETVEAGDLITIASGADAGKFKVAGTAADVVYGVAMTDAAKDEIFTLSMLPVMTTIPK